MNPEHQTSHSVTESNKTSDRRTETAAQDKVVEALNRQWDTCEALLTGSQRARVESTGSDGLFEIRSVIG
jgi:hypothetical protein